MKKLVIFCLLYNISYSQTLEERINILKSSDLNSIQNLNSRINSYLFTQKNLIKEFKINNPTFNNNENFVYIYNDIPLIYSTDNFSSAFTIRANSLHPGGALGLNVTGEGLKVGVWDGGKVLNTHQEFVNKITLGDNANTANFHATHVTGTIIATGISPSRKGFAYQATAKTHDFASDISEMVNFASDGFLVSNHSYGYVATNLQSHIFGKYDNQSLNGDDLMHTFPYYQIVKSAGNNRNDTNLSQVTLKSGFDLLTGFSNSKNVLTVCAVEHVASYTNPLSVPMSTFSNWGPTDDGRIKPDISAKGVNLDSTNSTSNTSYTTLSGTSMSAPSITGLILLLQKHYNNLNIGTFMKSSSIRGLLCHTAREAGSDLGPDYKFGWGLADGLTAAQHISNKISLTILEENTLINNQVYTKQIQITSTQNIKVTLCWTDPPGTLGPNTEDLRTPLLVNNLDLKIKKDGVTYYPWKLEPDLPSDPATRISDNEVDNIERVEIENAQPGIYTIEIKHKNTLNAPQDFSLLASSSNGLLLNNNSFTLNSVSIYPNPVNDSIYFNNINELLSVKVFDVLGKSYNNFSIKNNTLDVSNLESGIYFLKIEQKNNEIKTIKFIKN